MTIARWSAFLTIVVWCGGACRRGSSPPDGAASPPAEEPPVALNADAPVQYPPSLFDQRVEGDVMLRLFVDSTGRLVPESTKVQEPSGYAAFDSAAVAGAKQLRFAPARRHGVPVSTWFRQPIEFRYGPGAVARRPPPHAPAPRPTPAAPSPTVTTAPAVVTPPARARTDTVKPVDSVRDTVPKDTTQRHR
jgi:protein TonB